MAKSKAKPKAKAKPAVKVVAKSKSKIKSPGSAPKKAPVKAPKMTQTAAPKKATKVSPQALPKNSPVPTKLTFIKGGKSAFLMPLDDRLLVEKLVMSDRTPGGLYIPDMAQERPTKGKVLAVGKGHRDAKGRIRPLDVKVGDVVLFTQWSGSEIELDGTTYLIMRETDLFGVSTD